jgi:hypothetical protein
LSFNALELAGSSEVKKSKENIPQKKDDKTLRSNELMERPGKTRQVVKSTVMQVLR